MTKTSTALFLRGTAILALTVAGSAAFAQAAPATEGGTLIDGTTANPSIDAGTGDGKGIENVITVTGNFDGNSYSNDAFENVDVIASNPALTVEKVADITTDAEVGDVITYTYTIENTGNVILTGVTLADNHVTAGGAANLPVQSCIVTTDTTAGVNDQLNVNDTTIVGGTGTTSDSFSSFGPGDIVECTAKYTVTQADVDGLQDATPAPAPQPQP